MRYIKTYEGLKSDLLDIESKFQDRKKEITDELNEIDATMNKMRIQCIEDNKAKLTELALEITDEYNTTIRYRNSNDVITARYFQINIDTNEVDYDKLESILSRFERKCSADKFVVRYDLHVDKAPSGEFKKSSAETSKDAIHKMKNKGGGVIMLKIR